jgi:hypothetical protein
MARGGHGLPKVALGPPCQTLTIAKQKKLKPGASSLGAKQYGDRPTDQPTNRPTDQPTNRPTNQPTNRPIDQPTDEESYIGAMLAPKKVTILFDLNAYNF